MIKYIDIVHNEFNFLKRRYEDKWPTIIGICLLVVVLGIGGLGNFISSLSALGGVLGFKSEPKTSPSICQTGVNGKVTMLGDSGWIRLGNAQPNGMGDPFYWSSTNILVNGANEKYDELSESIVDVGQQIKLKKKHEGLC